jgi:ribonuclease P protein component
MSPKDNKIKDSLTRHTFKFQEKLHSQNDFKKVLTSGRRVTNPAIFIYVYKVKDGGSLRRLGLVTSRKIGIAAHRNRVKRRLREIFRLNKHKLEPGIDIVCVAKPGAAELSFDKLENIVLSALIKVNVLT